ncbi:MAG: hypothetical protein WAO71_05360 [Gallionella sp.]
MPLVGGCGDNTITWTEEVKLLDGRVITVTQKRRIEGQMPREAWLTFKLPEFGDKEIVWHENLGTQVLNVYQGKLYVISDFPSIVEFRQYGSPFPAYVAFRYDNGQWLRILFNEIPKAIYDSNMYFDNMALYRLKHVSLEHKAGMMKKDTYMPPTKHLDPTYLITE